MVATGIVIVHLVHDGKKTMDDGNECRWSEWANDVLLFALCFFLWFEEWNESCANNGKADEALAVLTPTQKYPIYIIRDTASSATDHNYFAKNTKASLFHFFTCFISHQHHLISHRIFIILDLCRRRSSLIHSPISLSVISHREYLDSCQYFHSQCRRHQFQPLVLIRHWYHHRIASQIASSVPCFLIVFSLSLSNCYQIVSTARW